MVPSASTYLKSESSDRAAKMRSNAPRSTQRRNRLNTEFHCPKPAGRSRQGEPVRAIHNTASRNRRASPPVCPGSPCFPRQWGAMALHCASVKTNRFICISQIYRRNPIERQHTLVSRRDVLGGKRRTFAEEELLHLFDEEILCLRSPGLEAVFIEEHLLPLYPFGPSRLGNALVNLLTEFGVERRLVEAFHLFLVFYAKYHMCHREGSLNSL